MIPQFRDRTEMMEYLGTVPKASDWRTKLKEDFSLDMPSDAAPYEGEFLWKFAVQEVFVGTPQEEVLTKASSRCKMYFKMFPNMVTEGKKGFWSEAVKQIENSDLGGKKIMKPQGARNKFSKPNIKGVGIEVAFTERDQAFCVFKDGKFVSKSKDEDAAKAKAASLK
jgi:hypothetical protein